MDVNVMNDKLIMWISRNFLIDTVARWQGESLSLSAQA